MIKELNQYLATDKAAYNPLAEKWQAVKSEIEEMIFKEEEIMVPMTLDVFSLADWQRIAEDSFDIGFAYIPEPLPWKPSQESLEKELEREPARQLAIKQAQETTAGIAAGLGFGEFAEPPVTTTAPTNQTVQFPTGSLQLEQLIAMFQTLPVDLTFVDNEDRVRFYSEGKSRVFPRTNSVIGREVVNCHPPKSMHIVQKILDDFRSDKRETADFWIDMRGRKIYIRYFALKNPTGKYLGCLEVTQDITEIQKIEGQSRLLDEE